MPDPIAQNLVDRNPVVQNPSTENLTDPICQNPIEPNSVEQNPMINDPFHAIGSRYRLDQDIAQYCQKVFDLI